MRAGEQALLIGRRAQLALVEEAVQQTESGVPQLVLVGGEAGVGKSHLMGYVADRLSETGARVLRTACVELGTHGLPLAAVQAALRQMIEIVGVDVMRRTMPGADGVLQLLPEYGDTLAEPHQHARAADLFAMMLERFGTEHPAVLIIDDLQWADRSTLDLLSFLARTLRPCRVLILGAYRTDDLSANHPLRPILAELARLPAVRRVDLGRFNRAETAELLAGVLRARPSNELLERIFYRSGGNAFFASELARHRDSDLLPESLQDLLLRQLRELPDRSRQVVRLAAVGGASVTHRLLAATSGLPDTELVAAIGLAVDARMLVPDGRVYAFRHALVREAVLSSMLPVERDQLHRTFAETLESKPALASPDRFAAEVAYHWHEAGFAAKALPALVRAADEAQRLSAFAERAQTLELASRMWLRVPEGERAASPDLLHLADEAVTAAGWAGDHVRAKRLVEFALAHVNSAAVSEHVAMLYAHQAMALHSLGEDGVPASVDRALATLPSSPTRGRARVLDLLAVVLLMRDGASAAGRLAQEAVTIAAEHGDADLEISSRTTLGWALLHGGNYREALSILSAARDTAAARGNDLQLARIELNAAQAWQGLGGYRAAIDAARASVDAAARAGVARGLGLAASINLSLLLTTVGRWPEADAAATAGLELDPPGQMAAALHAVRAFIAAGRGEYDLAHVHLSLALAMIRDTDLTPWSLVVLGAQADIALDENQIDEARAVIARALPVLRMAGYQWHAWNILVAGARVERRARLRSAVLNEPYDGGLTSELRSLAAHPPSGSPAMAAYAAHFAAEMDEPGAAWADVAAAWATLGQPYWAAYAELRAAEVALSAGNRDEARALLDQAVRRASDLPARPLIEEARLLARGHGLVLAEAPGEQRTVSVIERLGLTRREIEVLRQVADGRSNRQIAENLFISTKTVSVHVSNILAKLGVASRGEAAATAYRLRLFDSDPASG